MHPFEVLADPVRRRVLEVLGPGEVAAGGIAELVSAEFGISQPAVSQHLRVLREAGLVEVRADGTRRLYRVVPARLAEAATWFDQFVDPFQQPLDALATELARGQKEHRRSAPAPSVRDRLAGPESPAASDGAAAG